MMEYLAFALKYRPQNFDQVIGQAHVVTSLKSAITKQRVHHAYLFSGPRGTGKTSLARILAKSLNCAQGPTVNPCGKCISCLEISRGISLDVIEIDGASNRGIDEIRTLRENVKLSPAASRYKIYIIDEVHMLTQEAFNALLKTLEEPPSHVKFIFATTHPQKVLPTILSRCQKFQFNLLPQEKIIQKLKIIVKEEKLNIEDSFLYAIGQAAGGSIRDAESLLDQLSPVALEGKSIKDILSFLGVIDEESLNTILKYLIEKDLSASLSFIDKMAMDGKDLSILLGALIEHLRVLLLAKVSIKSFDELVDISPSSKDFILKLSELISAQEVLRAIDLFIETKELARNLNTARIPLELAIIKLSYEEKTCQKKEGSNGKSKNREESFSPTQEVSQDDFTGKIDSIDLEEKQYFDTESKEKEEGEVQKDNILWEEIKNKWEQIISALEKNRAAIASHLSFSQVVSSSGNIVRVAFSKKDCFHKDIVESNKNLKFIEESISKFMGKPIKIKFILSENTLSMTEEKNKGRKAGDNIKEYSTSKVSMQDNQLIDELLDTFKGNLYTGD